MKWWEFLRRERRLMMASAFFMITGAALNLVTPWPVKYIVDNVLKTHEAKLIFLAAAANLLCIFLRGFFNTNAHAYTSRLAERLAMRLETDLFARVTGLPLGFHDRARAGDLGSRVTEDVTRLKEAWKEGFSLVVVEALTFFGIAAILFVVDWRFAVLALSVLLPLFWVFGHFPHLIQEQSRLARESDGDKAAIVHETLGSLRLVKSYARERAERNRFVERGHASFRAQGALAKLEGRFIFVVEMFTALGASLVIGYGGWRVMEGTLTLGAMLVFLQYLTILYTPVGRLSRLAAVVQKASASIERIGSLMAIPAERAGTRTPSAGMRGAIAFRDVTFSYYEGGRRVLDDLSFDIAPGERVAILGKTGEGKSSLLHLLLQFYRPTSGTITIDGTDISTLDLGALRKQIALLSQDPCLLRASFHDNIAYGARRTTRAEVIEVAKAAYAHDFISRLPDGYDTMIGERGVSLSGGERQRIAIARALLKRAPILLLDEPTSAIDDRSEEVILEALARLFADRTVIFTTHRKSLLRLASRVVTLREGRLVDFDVVESRPVRPLLTSSALS